MLGARTEPWTFTQEATGLYLGPFTLTGMTLTQRSSPFYPPMTRIHTLMMQLGVSNIVQGHSTCRLEQPWIKPPTCSTSATYAVF